MGDAEEATEQAPKKNGRRASKTRMIFRIRLEKLPILNSADDLEDEIRRFMRRTGASNPVRVEVVLDPITGRPRGYAYVDYSDAAAADLAVRADGADMLGCPVSVFKEDAAPA